MEKKVYCTRAMIKSGKCKEITGNTSSVHTRKRCPNGQVRDRSVKTHYHCIKKNSAKRRSHRKSTSGSFHLPFSNSVSKTKSRSRRKSTSSSGSFLLPFSNSSRNSDIGYNNYRNSSSSRMKYHDNPLFGKRRAKKSRSRKSSRRGSAASLSHSKIYRKSTSSGMKYHDNPLFGKRRVKKSRSKGSRKGSASSLSHSKIYGKKTSSGIKYSAVNPLFNPKKK